MFALTEWGFLDLPKSEPAPSWIKMKSDDISDGIIFQVTPQAKDANKKITVYYMLTD